MTDVCNEIFHMCVAIIHDTTLQMKGLKHREIETFVHNHTHIADRPEFEPSAFKMWFYIH